MSDQHVFYTVREVSSILRKTNGSIRRWCHEGVIPSCKIGGSLMIPAARFDAWLEAQVGSQAAEQATHRPEPSEAAKPISSVVEPTFQNLDGFKGILADA